VASKSVLRLPLVLPGHELSRTLPIGFERAAKTCRPGDLVHLALLDVASRVARRALTESLPPTARAPFERHLETCRDWNGSRLAEVKNARAQAFDGAPDAEQTTLAALTQVTAVASDDPLDRQAGLTLRRYAARGVHHAVACVLQTLDAVLTPVALLPIAEEAAGAIAFTRVALGPVRSLELRAAARAQAEWEVRGLASNEQPAVAIALQLFHEYLGAQWKDHADAQRAHFDDFLVWAFPR
jgi:hypothetical protein